MSKQAKEWKRRATTTKCISGVLSEFIDRERALRVEVQSKFDVLLDKAATLTTELEAQRREAATKLSDAQEWMKSAGRLREENERLKTAAASGEDLTEQHWREVAEKLARSRELMAADHQKRYDEWKRVNAALRADVQQMKAAAARGEVSIKIADLPRWEPTITVAEAVERAHAFSDEIDERLSGQAAREAEANG